MKRLFFLIFFNSFTLYLSAQTVIKVENIIYDGGKRRLDQTNFQLDDYTHLKILFDSVKVRYAERFHLVFPKLNFPNKIPFEYKNDGCKVIADNFMEFAGSYKFEDSSNIKRVKFGEGYVCSYVNIDTPPMKTDSFEFTDHRVVKFKLKDNTEYVFDMVISKNEPIELQKWLSIYRKVSNTPKLEFTELTLTESIKGSGYSSSLASVVKGMNVFQIKASDKLIFFEFKPGSENNAHSKHPINKSVIFNSKSKITLKKNGNHR